MDHLGEFVVLWKKGARVLSVGKLLVRKDGKVAKLNEPFLKFDFDISRYKSIETSVLSSARFR